MSRGDPPVAGSATRRDEVGAGTVLVLAALGAVVVVLAGALMLVAAVRDAHRARSAADLAALAAASGPAAGEPPDCAAAAQVARAMGASVRECGAQADGSVTVRVGVRISWPARWPGLPDVVTGSARAGLDAVAPP